MLRILMIGIAVTATVIMPAAAQKKVTLERALLSNACR